VESDVIFTRLGSVLLSHSCDAFKSDFMVAFYMDASHLNGVYKVYPHRCGN